MCCGKHINKMGWKEKRASVKVLLKERHSPQRADKQNRKEHGRNLLPQQETRQLIPLDLKAGNKDPERPFHLEMLINKTEIVTDIETVAFLYIIKTFNHEEGKQQG